MDYEVVEVSGLRVVEFPPDVLCLSSERDALDMLAACSESETNLLLLHSGNISPDFFRLSTGLAGAVLLKFVMYRVKVAAVVQEEQVRQGKFYDFALETNRGRDFRIFNDRQSALAWLTAA